MQPVVTTMLGVLTSATVALTGTLSATSTTAQEEIPIKGQSFGLGTVESGSPAVFTVHGVRRTDKATIVYWSLGLPQDAAGDNAMNYLGPSTTTYFNRKVGPKQGDVALVDSGGSDSGATRIFRPMEPGGKFESCVCSKQKTLFELKPGQAGVVWSAVASLPAEVTEVDVVVGEQIIPNVPVEDGPMEPVAPEENEVSILGFGWPKIDDELLANAKTPEPAFYSLTSRVSNLEQTVTRSKGTVDLATDVLFDKDSATLSPKADSTIQAAAAEIKAAKIKGGKGGKDLNVTGYTDSVGSDSDNLELSILRAKAVAEALVHALGSDYGMIPTGKGEKEPIADNDTEAGKAKNRRVTITFEGEK
ncbi:OmpA family protein [Neomicrococcus lactis]